MENTLHYNTLMLQLCYLQSNKPLRSTFSLTTGLQKEEGVGAVGAEVLSLSRTWYENKTPNGLNGISGLLNPSPRSTLQPQSAQSVSARTYIDIKQGAAFSSSSL